MKALSKADAAEKERLVAALFTAADKVKTAIASYNKAMEEAKAPVQQAVKAYNETVEQAKDFAEQIAADIQASFEDKSEKWQESDKGQACRGWIEEWENVDFGYTVEAAFPDELEEPEMTAGETLENLPDEADC